MEGSAKVLSPSLEELAFRKYYGDLLRSIRNPILFAEDLLQKGVIGRDTKDRISSSEEKHQKRVLLASLQQALYHSRNKKEVLAKAREALQNSGGDTYSFYHMDEFVDREFSTVPFKV